MIAPSFPEQKLMPKTTHPCHQDHKDEWEDAKMPTPAHERHCDHSDEQEDGFQDEVCNDPRKHPYALVPRMP